jgi:hypothetical protein
MQQGIPSTIRAGDTLSFSVCAPSFLPSAGWVLHCGLKNVGNAYTFASSSSSGDSHVINTSPSATAAWLPGRYMLAWWVERGTSESLERHTLGVKAVEVLPDASSADPSDGRSWARRALDAIEAVIEQRASRADMEYRINGRMVRHFTPEELMKQRSLLKSEVQAEDASAALNAGQPLPSRRIYVRLGR